MSATMPAPYDNLEPPYEEEAPEPRIFIEQDDIDRLENALLPAALCAASYTANCWAFDVASGEADPRAWMDEQSFKADRGALARALFIKKLCTPLSAGDIGLDEKAMDGASLERGIWRNGTLASALVCSAFNPFEQQRELHLCIRGTDLALSPSKVKSAFEAVIGYFLWTYLRIEKHAANFEPLVDALAKYVKTANPPFSKIVVSGHSLGAAAAETLYPRLANLGIPSAMIGFGSPGTGSGWAGLLFAATRLAKDIFRAPLVFATNRLPPPNKSWPGFRAFSKLARDAAKNLAPQEPLKLPLSAQVIQFRHPNDLIPKLGTLLYTPNGLTLDAMLPTEFEARLNGREIELPGLAAHSCARYFISIEAMGLRALSDIAPYAELTPNLRAASDAKLEAIALDEMLAPDQAAKAVTQARLLTIETLRAHNPNDPTLERLESFAPPLDLKDKIKKARKFRKMIAMASIPIQPNYGR